jgi:DNA-binding MarR family transcriptional regulator
MIHPATGLNDIVHQRTRLGILTILQEAGGPVDFVALRDQLAVSDGSLSQHIRVLEEASYATIEKSFAGKRPRTRIKITKPGTKALAHELELLRQIVALGLSA